MNHSVQTKWWSELLLNFEVKGFDLVGKPSQHFPQFLLLWVLRAPPQLQQDLAHLILVALHFLSPFTFLQRHLELRGQQIILGPLLLLQNHAFCQKGSWFWVYYIFVGLSPIGLHSIFGVACLTLSCPRSKQFEVSLFIIFNPLFGCFGRLRHFGLLRYFGRWLWLLRQYLIVDLFFYLMFALVQYLLNLLSFQFIFAFSILFPVGFPALHFQELIFECDDFSFLFLFCLDQDFVE